jgi:hypothetical protein
MPIGGAFSVVSVFLISFINSNFNLPYLLNLYFFRFKNNKSFDFVVLSEGAYCDMGCFCFFVFFNNKNLLITKKAPTTSWL